MCGTLSWTLAVVNGGNVGENRATRQFFTGSDAYRPLIHLDDDSDVSMRLTSSRP